MMNTSIRGPSFRVSLRAAEHPAHRLQNCWGAKASNSRKTDTSQPQLPDAIVQSLASPASIAPGTPIASPIDSPQPVPPPCGQGRLRGGWGRQVITITVQIVPAHGRPAAWFS